jgi:hypothetical protein
MTCEPTLDLSPARDSLLAQLALNPNTGNGYLYRDRMRLEQRKEPPQRAAQVRWRILMRFYGG